MPDRLPTKWPIEPHTLKKHEILRRYLDAWLGILAPKRTKLVYLDGFAGPGEYDGGEPGSPIIAIERALNHKLAERFAGELVFYFIEYRSDRAENLEKVLKKRFPQELLASRRIRYSVHKAQFAPQFEEVLNRIEEDRAKLAPTFAFLDPFGFSGIPMLLFKRVLAYPTCEVLVTFMEGFVNRFADAALKGTFDELFGSTEWTNGLRLEGAAERREFWLSMYQDKLRTIGGAELVRSFEMINRFNQTEYYLVYGTKHWRGLEVMKEAMWAVDPAGRYRFSDRTDPRQKLLLDYTNQPGWAQAAMEAVWNAFRGRVVGEESVHRFVVTDTPYLYRKKAILWSLRDDGRITAQPESRGFPDGCTIRFRT